MRSIRIGAPWALMATLAVTAGPALADEPTQADVLAADEDDEDEKKDEDDKSAAVPAKQERKESLGTEEEEEEAAAALGAANPVVASNTGKPWQLMGNIGLSFGSSTFTQNQRTQAGYNVALTGLYRLAPLFEGRLDVLARVAADQMLSEGYNVGAGATQSQQFFFRDVRLGLLGRGLYKWKALGLTVGANTSVDLPTSENAQFWGRILRWNVGLNLADMISNVGPGNLLVTASFGFRKDVGEVNPTVGRTGGNGSNISVCRSSNQADSANCYTDLAPLNFGFIYGAGLRYFLGDFSLGGSVTFLNNFNHSLNDTEIGQLEAGVGADGVRVSDYANDAPDHTLLMFTSLDLTYVISSHFNVSAGLSSFQVPIRYQGGNNKSVVSPLFDSPERNATSASLSFTAMY